MKKLVCEVCGSTDLVKQDGLFVCQHCGTKYTLDEVKNLLSDGSVEVQVQNSVQPDNLMLLAESSFKSGNYAQAEDFCNQILAINGSDYAAWKLKGEAINCQITGTNNRIDEVYNCIMTSYDVLDETGKDAHREEIMFSLKACLEGEIDFSLQLLESHRPTETICSKVKTTFLNCASKVVTSYEKLGYPEAETAEYREYIKAYFIRKVNQTCQNSWTTTVYYNYYRGGWTDEFHPTKEILGTFRDESMQLVYLLDFVTGIFADTTPSSDKISNYTLQKTILSKLVGAIGYKRMVSTTTNGYGAVIKREEYWQADVSLSSSDIASIKDRMDSVDIQMAKVDTATRERLLAQWKKEREELTMPLWNIGDLWGFLGTFGVVAAVCVALRFLVNFLMDADMALSYIDLIWVALFAIVEISTIVSVIKEKKEIRAANTAKTMRLNKKIREVSN